MNRRNQGKSAVSVPADETEKGACAADLCCVQKEVLMEQYQKLRKEFPRFFYRGYKIEETASEWKVTYGFEIEGLSTFAPQWTFPKKDEGKNWSKDALMDKLAFHLGMVELVSYWKITCSPNVIVEAGSLNADQIAWWKNLYFNGLGEFFYVNGIAEADPKDFMELTCKKPGQECEETITERPEGAPKTKEENAAFYHIPAPKSTGEKVLVPIGGGKDSAVTLELLKSTGAECFAYIINPRGATIHTTEAAGLDNSHVLSVKRTLDANMLELNKKGYLNGHTPFSALVAFSSLIAARMLGISYIALSNESSANESTVKGSTVNHQYSKSFQFEEDFHRYETDYLPESAFYFSMLRPLSEYQIARYFAGQKQYHAIFRSCNAGSKTDSWCGHCPKCLFVYLILSPFLSRAEVKEIFGRDMLEDESLKKTLEQLIGLEEEKPFECVGSRDEINTAIVSTIDRLNKDREELPALLSYYMETGLYEKYRAMGDHYSTYFDEQNLLPEGWKELVRKNCCKAQ